MIKYFSGILLIGSYIPRNFVIKRIIFISLGNQINNRKIIGTGNYGRTDTNFYLEISKVIIFK